MENTFLCPECRGILNPKDYLILSMKAKNNQRGLVLLHPELGNYSKTLSDGMKMEEGSKIDIFCPICHTSLVQSKANTKLAKVLMVDKNGEEHNILFSGIFGEHCTYKVTGEKVEKYGKDAQKHINYENLSNLL